MKNDNKRIDIYPNAWKALGIFIASSLFVVILYFMPPRDVDEEFVRYFGMAFFSLGFVPVLLWLTLVVMRKPLAIIYDDRLEYLIPVKMKYEVIPYMLVEAFGITKPTNVEILNVRYLNGYVAETGIISVAAPVCMVCNILNGNLKQYRKQPVLSQELDQALVAQYLKSMGVKSWQFGFDTTNKPDCFVVMRDGIAYKLVYFDHRGSGNMISNHLTENDACYALLGKFTQEKAFKS